MKMKNLMFLAARKSWMSHFPGLVLAMGSALLISFMPLTVWGGMINGTVKGSKVTATGVYDDTFPSTVTSETIDITYFTSCYFLTDGIDIQKFGSYNFVFAGQGVASGIANIDASDFTISQYKPWVVNNNATKNFVTGPDAVNYNRNVTNQDDGGANIVISYTPQYMRDPTKVNFVQAFIRNINNAGFRNGVIDNGGSSGPFYNQANYSGTGMTMRLGTIPLVSSADVPAWLIDIPYASEMGNSPPYADDTINSQTQIFQTFISGVRDDLGDGKTYNVLYGGVQWGYTFTTVDIPEPVSVLLALIGVGSVGILRRCKVLR